MDRKRLDEGFEIRDFMCKMPKSVTLNEEWFVYSMEWLQQWERYVYFDLIEESKPSSEEKRPHPGPVDCSAITEAPNRL